ncbi:BppU family phage baseplate upper protein [Weissella paramesenteroides]|uniref:BppU family phage baseplate upper protein n=1 Tax=Weissella paramesenteroides TaxID=1249 RepID=UPI003982B97E
MSNQYLSFDVTKQSAPQQLIMGRQGDSQLKFVSVLLWDGDKNIPYDLTGKQIAFEALKPDGTHIIDYNGITILDTQHGLFRYSFNEQVFSVAGTMQQAFFKITHTDSGNNVIADSTLEVAINILENRVEFGINSTDYLSEYDDLIAQVKKKFDDYAATVQDSIDKATALHADIISYLDLIKEKQVLLFNDSGEVINNHHSGEALLTDSSGNNIPLYVKGHAKTTDGLDDFVNNNFETNLEGKAVIGGLTDSKEISKLEQLKSKIDHADFNLVFITDVHYGRWDSSPNRLNNFTLKHLNNALYMNGVVDVIVYGGDNIDGWTRNRAAMLNEQHEFGRKALFGRNNGADKFILKGNHDDASGNIYQYKNGDFAYLNWLDGNLGYSSAVPKIITDDELKWAYKTKEKMFGESRNGDSFYFYKDYPDKKIRLVGLNSNDTPTVLDSNGYPKYIGLINVGFQQEQLNWLANIALKNIPEDYATLIVSHVPPTSLSSDSHNQNLVNQIINDFKTGKKNSVTSAEEDWQVNVNYDFSGQGERDVIAYVSGHLHEEFLVTTPGFNSISVTSSINSGADSAAASNAPDTDGWSIISVNKTNRHINIFGFDRGTDRTTDY